MPYEIRDASFTATISPGGAFLEPNLAEVVFAGRSNVGKSSLINALTRRKKLARTSNTPGCTRGIIFFTIEPVRSPKFSLVDLPGYGYAKRSKTERAAWGELIESYLTTRPTVRGLVLLVDLRRGIEEEEALLVDYLQEKRDKRLAEPWILLVATKIDKIPKAGRKTLVSKTRAMAHGIQLLACSSETGEGVEDLWNLITKKTFVPVPPDVQDVQKSQATSL